MTRRFKANLKEECRSITSCKFVVFTGKRGKILVFSNLSKHTKYYFVLVAVLCHC